MPDIKISALTAALSLGGTEAIPAVQGGGNVRLTPDQLAAHALGLVTPPFQPGRTYTQPRNGANSMTCSSGMQYYVPLVIGRRVTVAALGLSVITTAAGSVLLGIYGQTNGQPGARLEQIAAAISSGSAGVATAALVANITLNPGLYFLSALFSAGPTVLAVNGVDGLNVALLGGATPAAALANGANFTGFIASQSFASGLQASASGFADRVGQSPLIGFTVAS